MDAGILRETFRYLGYRGAEPEPAVREAAISCLEELEPLLERREIHRFFTLERPAEGVLRIEGTEIRSSALSRNLRECAQVCLMAATIGPAPDRLAARSSAMGKVGRAAVIQAAGAALIEDWCGRVNEQIRAEAAAEGFFLRPRFSPGYGDLALEHQRDLFRILQITKHTGITLTESLLMQPTKSVTALIGLTGRDTGCEKAGCDSCGKAAECQYKRV